MLAVFADALGGCSSENVAPEGGKCAVGGCGGMPTVLAPSQMNPLAVAIDTTSVYAHRYRSHQDHAEMNDRRGEGRWIDVGSECSSR